MIRCITTILATLALLLTCGGLAAAKAPSSPARIVAEYPHDNASSTQGLLYNQGKFYETSGGYGESFLAIVDPATGRRQKTQPIGKAYFAEGLTLHNDHLYLLTWKSGTGFIYDINSLEPRSSFHYRPSNSDTEGWGLTHDTTQFVLSDGTARLYTHSFIDFARTGSTLVHDGDKPVHQLNELEFVNGFILANVWKSDMIAIINPHTGSVTRWIDLTPLRARLSPQSGVANGIAYDPVTQKLYITGKHWDKLFEITIDNAPWL